MRRVVDFSSKERLSCALVLWKKEWSVINKVSGWLGNGEKLLELSYSAVLSEKQLHPKDCFQQPRVYLRSWTNNVGLEQLPSISNQPLLVGAGTSHDLHHESVKLHLEQYKLLPFLIPPWDFFSPEFEVIASKACSDLFPRSLCVVSGQDLQWMSSWETG